MSVLCGHSAGETESAGVQGTRSTAGSWTQGFPFKTTEGHFPDFLGEEAQLVVLSLAEDICRMDEE